MENKQFLKLYICTWNVNTKEPDFDLSRLLNLNDSQELADIYIIGLQEVNSKPWRLLVEYFTLDPWTIQLTSLLSKFNYFRLKSTRLVGNLLNIFIKKELINEINEINIDWIRLGFFGLWGNKGVNIATFNLFNNKQITLVNAHLTAHEHNDKKRIKEYKQIIESGHHLLLNTNTTFFFGDLNFRLKEFDYELIQNKINSNEYEVLLEKDQLLNSIRLGQCFNDFQEATIKFPPTYKFDINSDTYDTSSKKRRPGWCDRILYRSTQSDHLKCTDYNYLNDYKLSDHRPVYAQFQINTQFTYFNKKNIEFSVSKTGTEQSNRIDFVVLMNDTHFKANKKDWIGLYKREFTHSLDYLSFVWSNDTNKYLFKFIDHGCYYLGYFSYESDQLIAVSNEFEISTNKEKCD